MQDIPGVKLSAIDKSTWGYRVALRPYANKVYAVSYKRLNRCTCGDFVPNK
jgi:hypothetical protein